MRVGGGRVGVGGARVGAEGGGVSWAEDTRGVIALLCERNREGGGVLALLRSRKFYCITQ